MERILVYIDELILKFHTEEQELIRTERKDEANFVRIKINICEISKTLYNVSAKRFNGAELKEEYIRQLTRLPENWEISYEKAKEHNDVQKIVIEETKMEVLKMIKDKFLEMEECE